MLVLQGMSIFWPYGETMRRGLSQHGVPAPPSRDPCSADWIAPSEGVQLSV